MMPSKLLIMSNDLQLEYDHYETIIDLLIKLPLLIVINDKHFLQCLHYVQYQGTLAGKQFSSVAMSTANQKVDSMWLGI